MDLITTHTNADFDALASMVAARKLYPGARLVLPGSQERAVRDFISLSEDLVKIEREKDASFEGVRRLIVVETRSPSRIGKMARLLGKKGIEVHVYDHHQRSPGDIKAEKDVYEKTGATTTILAETIKRQGLRVSPLEATIMALGIYEDTGSLTFPTTTERDIAMAGFLISRGADLDLVSSYLRRGLTDKELNLLARLIQATEIHIINGIHIAVSSAVSEEYVDDLSLLAHKMEEAENYNATFIFVQTKEKVQFIARSGIKSIDVSRAAAIFGGGGHPSAAGAVIKGLGAKEAKDMLLSYLRKHVRSETKAKDLMDSGPLFLEIDASVSAAKEALSSYGTEYAAVKSEKGFEGIISLKDLDKAISRGFGHARIKGYMSRNPFPVKPDTSIYSIQSVMQDNNVGCVPVISTGNKLAGLVTRTDLLRAFHGRLFGGNLTEDSPDEGHLTLNLTPRISGVLPAKVAELLRFSGRIAESMGFKAFAVGGFVRDLMLGTENYDIDLVIEGDAIAFAKKIAGELCGIYVYHKRFGTGTVFIPCPKGIPSSRSSQGRCKIDIAMTRTEVYEQPAALPTVKFGPLENDLYRRDFTINAMALGLARGNFGRLVDPFNGKRDLKEGKIRVLHDLSFVDDPTRIFRAVRFEQRFDFRIEPHTEELIKKAVGLRMVDRTQKQRIREELIALLSEQDPLKAVRRLAELNELRFVEKDLKLTKGIVSAFGSVGETLKWYNLAPIKKCRSIEKWLLYMAALVDELPVQSVKKICSDFVLRKDDASKLLSYKANRQEVYNLLSRKGKLPASRIFSCLEGFSHEVLLMFMVHSGSQTARRRIMAYMTNYSDVRLSLRGDDLKKAGIKPGPHFRQIMRKTLLARLDGRLKSKEEELYFALKGSKRT